MCRVNEGSASSFLGPSFSIFFFMADLFLFIEICNLYNYADDNPLDWALQNLGDVL